jgi:hypothetical protein
MERYTVTVSLLGTESFRLLIPFPPTSSVFALATEVKKRISRQDAWPDVADISLRLGDIAGPFLDEEDLLEDVILDPKVETIAVTSRNSTALAKPTAPPAPSTSNHVCFHPQVLFYY